MKYGIMRSGSFLIRALFAAGLILILAGSLPQMFLHLRKPFVPENKAEIKELLDKETLCGADYELLYEQTGLAQCAIDEIRNGEDYKKEDLLQFQKALLSKPEIECGSSGLFTRQDRIKAAGSRRIPMAPVEEGDIFLSFSSHTFGWRHGHAGLVVNAQKGECLEAMTIGCDSEIKSLNHWRNYSNFLILRLKAEFEERKQIAVFARKSLQDIPYDLVSGIFGDKAPAESEGLTAQCAYLIWYAFARFGYDLDGDGGKIVTVKDLAESEKLQVVQVYGLDPAGFNVNCR